jgi:hypothetical protein
VFHVDEDFTSVSVKGEGSQCCQGGGFLAAGGLEKRSGECPDEKEWKTKSIMRRESKGSMAHGDRDTPSFRATRNTW